MNAAEETRAQRIRRHAHRLAAEGLNAALNMWELDRYYPDQEDQDALESELLRIIARLNKQGGEAPTATSQDGNGWPGDEHAEPGTRGWTV
jgi:hypothetical protein